MFLPAFHTTVANTPIFAELDLMQPRISVIVVAIPVRVHALLAETMLLGLNAMANLVLVQVTSPASPPHTP